ncbi:hypothetical protein NA57DRAFT_68099 [Rhizodiscina lignyota]|uniref:P-loop containing nucleoside triphosphate hydrolase protein n=1 Tax=Rhizodiscina lignyota TaxID=1504668 RepID=A0A9P4M6R2_9PEZI|nr:hypothetical protein NA57DRAFT_68099 [Rhizodiscina lignyota]
MVESILERTLYAVTSTPQPPRTKPMRVLCVGISRSATESLREALIQLGYRPYHGWELFEPGHAGDFRIMSNLVRRKYRDGPHDGNVKFTADDFDKLYASYDAISDVPGYVIAREVIMAYPEAKVIMNRRRDLDAWHKSMYAVFGAAEDSWLLWIGSWFVAELYWTLQLCTGEINKFFFRGSFRYNGKWVNEEHTAMVKGLVPEERLLEWDAKDGWEPLCKFLDKQVPDTKFPHGNMGTAFMNRLHEVQKDQYRRALKNMGITAIALALVGFGMYRLVWPRVPSLSAFRTAFAILRGR